jgi:hypothetical protein
LREMARPERFELPTTRFEAEYSIQLSYGRADTNIDRLSVTPWSLRIHCGNSDFPKPLITNPSRRDSNQRLTRSKPGTLSN